MAVYTPLSDAQIAEFLSRYDLGALREARGIAEGIENTNYLLVMQDGRKAILTLFEQRVRAEDLPFFMAYKEHLNRAGCHCPSPYHDRDGKVVGTLAGKPAVLVSFLEGGGVAAPRREHLAALGTEMARMHLAVADFPLTRENTLAPDRLRPLYEKTAVYLDQLKPGLRALLETEMELMRRWPQLDLPRGVIHADLFPDNVFFATEEKNESGLTEQGEARSGGGVEARPPFKEELTGVIDFYFACTDYFAYDLVIALNAWCFDAPELQRALFEAYEAIRPLSEGERQALPFLARGAALRFLMTRTHDWFFPVEGAVVMPKDPMEYLRKWEYWREQ